MKKIVLVMMMALVSFGATAQKLNIQSALDEIKSGDFVKAKQYIDKATAPGSSTADNADAWMVKGAIYQAIGKTPTKGVDGKEVPYTVYVNGKARAFDIAKANTLRIETPNPFGEAVNAYGKVIQFSRKVNKNELQPLALDLLFQVYNQGANEFKNKKYAEAMKSFDLVNSVMALNDSKLLALEALPAQYVKAGVGNQIKDINKKSNIFKGYSAYNLGDNKVTLPILEANIASGNDDDQMYVMAAEIYKTNGDKAKYVSTLESGMKKFPESKTLRNEQLNYYITSGNQEVAVKKLEEALKKDPTNAELQFNTGIIYADLAEKTKDASLTAKAVAAYEAAIKNDPTNPDYVYNLGAMIYNKATILNGKMNKEKDDNKYTVMKKERDAIMAKSIPLFEQAKSVIESSKEFKTESSQKTYKDILTALNTAYIFLGKNDKVKEITPLLNGLK